MFVSKNIYDVFRYRSVKLFFDNFKVDKFLLSDKDWLKKAEFISPNWLPSRFKDFNLIKKLIKLTLKYIKKLF